MFWRNKDIELEIRYGSSSIDHNVLPTYAKNTPMPDWFKKIKSSSHTPKPNGQLGLNFSSTVKTCSGIVGTLTTGIYVLAPFDMLFYKNYEQCAFMYYAPTDYINDLNEHHPTQMGGALKNEYSVFKVSPGFSVRCKEATRFLVTYPVMYNVPSTRDITGPDGILDFKSQHMCNVFLMVRTPVDGSRENITIKKGTPIAKLTPLTERKVVLKYTETPDWQASKNGLLEGVSSDYNLNKLREMRN